MGIFPDLRISAIALGLSLLFNGSSSSATEDNNDDPGTPLFLTPLIQNGEIVAAAEAALVKEVFPFVSYSGFITVNKTFNSNIFFWFFPAEGKGIQDNDAPVLLWSDGGPGMSGFFSVFTQNGPFTGMGAGDQYTLNPHSWHNKYNMIYMDNPVDVGFSFTENENGFVESAPEAALDIYEFLTQFFQLFPNLQKNPVYNAGVSYGGTYALQTANIIHQRNLEDPQVPINLTGIILDSPWIDSYNQVDYGDYLFNVGLISDESRKDFKKMEAELRELVEQDKYFEAFNVWRQLSQSDTFALTGYGAINNIYNDQMLPVDMTPFITKNQTRRALHVGQLNFTWVSTEQQSRMHANMLRSSKPEMETLLQAGYRFLLYVGNLDGLTGHLGIQRLMKSLYWDGASDVLNGERIIWKENERVAGYNMTASNMTFLVIRNAGHGCLLDQPAWVLSAVTKFLE